MSSPEMPLIGALVLAVALTANFFRAFWRMDLQRTRSTQRIPTTRRQVIACAVSGSLPLMGALVLLMVADRPWTPADAPALAACCALLGWTLHLIMDNIMTWGTPRLPR